MRLRALGFCFIGAISLAAQTPTATLTGRVEDATGAGIPGAAVKVRNVGTAAVRTAASDEGGDFTIPGLPPGGYEVEVEKTGFQRLRQSGIELQVDQTLRLNCQLQVGGVAESVDVRAEVPLLNTDNPVKGEVIVTEEIAEMPLEDRDFGDLAFLVPGVARRAQGGSGSRFNINGARSDNSNFLVDGFHDQDSRGGGIQVRPPTSAMQEFKMQTAGYPAEHGRFGGGVMNMVLKTGGNRFRGELFHFLRNDFLDARNFFAASKPKLRRNQFGATLHGPVILPRLYRGRNRTFFLLSWEAYRQNIGLTRRARVPTELERQGDFSQSRDASGAVVPLRDPLASGTCTELEVGGCFPANRIPASRLEPIALKIVPYYPLPNLANERNNLYVQADDRDAYDTYLGKADHRFNDRDTVSVRYLTRRSRSSNPFSGNPSGTFATRTRQAQSLAGITYTRLFSPVMINEARFGYARTSTNERSVFAGRDFNAEFGIPGLTTDPDFVGFPRITIRDLMAIGDAEGIPALYAVNNFQFGDTFTWVRQRHVLKFGGDVVRAQFFQVAATSARGLFNFLGRWTNQPFADFLLGMQNSSKRQQGTTPSYLLSNSYGFFVQDDFRARSSLTLNLGLRYELPMPAVEKYDRYGNFVPEFNQFIIADSRGVPDLQELLEYAGLVGRVALAREVGIPRSLIYTKYTNLAPRFGFAWRVGGGTRTVVRGGYGVFHGSSRTDNIRQDLAVVYPFSVIQTFNRQANNPSYITLRAPFRTARGTLEGVNNSFGHELRAPSQNLQSWNLTIERQIGASAAVELAYVGSKGTHLPRKYNINQPIRQLELRMPNGNFPRPYGSFNDIQYYGYSSNSSYNSGVLSVRRRFTRGFFYRVNYVYSKSIDEASQISGAGAGGYSGAQDPRNLKLERGRSDWDNGHSLTMSFSYETPRSLRRWLRNWQLSSTTRMYTGQPFTPRVSNVDLNLGEANRPDRIAKGRLDVRTPERWFDLAAFPPVPLGAYRMGNSGRNILDGPAAMNVNLSLSRRFYLGERGTMQFRSEAFNVPNHPNFQLPEEIVNAINSGVITQAGQARVFQFGLRYQF